MRQLLLILSFVTALVTFAQNQAVDSLHCDCKKAVNIPVYKKHHHDAPQGGGSVREFDRNGMRNPKYFDKEHNTVWYAFTVPNDGILLFDIIPDSIKDDYDFILFKQGGRGTCDSIKEKTLVPVRSNISHNSKKSKSLTGLSAGAHYDFIQPGVHEYYSNPLPVKSGERYLLVVDNVYEHGYGHTIKFYFKFKLPGFVVDSSDNKPLHATVSLNDLKTGKPIDKVSSDSTNRGFFEIPILLSDTLRWEISIRAVGYFNESVMLTQNNIGSFIQQARIFKLRKIVKDKSFAVREIYFYPNKDILKPSSLPALQNLLNMMKDNPTVKIRIEGHTNFDPTVTKEWDLKLSRSRAEAVSKYLNENGIVTGRIKTSGYGSARMIYPTPRNQQEQQANMRVEVKIEEF